MSEKEQSTTAEELENKAAEHTQTEAEAEKKAATKETYRVISPGRMVAKRFFRSRLSIAGLCMLIFVFAFSFLGPVIVNLTWGYGENEVFDVPRLSTMYTQDSFKGGDGQTYDFYDESVTTIKYKAPVSWEHWLGTDTSGMDIFVRLMYGGRISLSLSFLVVIMETLLGVFFGGLAGYFGKWVDQLIMRIVDVFWCLPGLPILLILSATISSIDSIPAGHRIYYVMAFLTLIGWSGTARLVRGQILMLREQEYMMAAEATGLPAWRKIFKHLIPNVMPQLIVSMTLGLGSVILYESTLSYLGIGVPFPNAAWGSMIALADPSKGQEILANYPNMWVPAGVLIVVAVLGFNFVGDGLRDAFDPKARK